MPPKGRKRLTEDDLRARIADYCRRHGVRPTAKGLPPFPAGQRESAQHRQWLGLYKLQDRLGRRARGQCERCASPASTGSIFCEEHRTSVTADHGANREDRQRLLQAQAARCPVCDQPVGAEDPVDRNPADGAARGLLHPPCSQLVALAEARGPEGLDRLRAYLWPRRGRRG